jgi:hypothetical protein
MGGAIIAKYFTETIRLGCHLTIAPPGHALRFDYDEVSPVVRIERYKQIDVFLITANDAARIAVPRQ